MMYPCRGVLHTPYKCPHSGQTDRPIWSDSPMCLFVLTPSIHELFTPSNYRSPSGSFVGRMQYAPTMIRKCYTIIRSFRSLPISFVGRMQYAPTLPDEKRMCQNAFSVLFETQNRIQMLLRYFLRLKIESKCFWGAFWGSKSNQNVFEVLFEAQNRIKMLLRCFLRLKIESKCFCGIFWGSKWSESIFEVYFLLNMADKETAGHLLLGCPAVKQSFWVLHETQNAVGSYLLLIETSMRLPWESSWLAKSRTDSMVRALTFFS